MSGLPAVFRVDKTTATHADALKAAGLADLLQSVFDKPVEIRDDGPSFAIILPEPLGSGIQRIPHSPRYPWLRANADEAVPKGLSSIDISAEFARVKRWAENRKKLSTSGNTNSELLQLVQQDAPIPRWWILAALTNSKLKANATWNRVAQEIANTPESQFGCQVEESLQSLIRGKASAVRWSATSNGAFCPSQIKGFNELKPQGTSRGSVPVDSFEEWLRYQGYWQLANLVSDSDNIRLYIPIPGRITSRSLGRLASRLEKERLLGCGPQSDILAMIALARLLIEHSREYHSPEADPDPELTLPSGHTPAQIVSGIHVTHYTKTSQHAFGVQSTFSLALPGWFPIAGSEDAKDWLGILSEHQRVVLGLQNDRSDEIGLLIGYRSFLQQRAESALWALVEFMEEYGVLVLRVNGLKHGNRTRWMTRFSCEYFRRVAMGMDSRLLEIVNDPGFEAVARAVRQSTVTAQNRKARGGNVWREIRYELLHDIHRTRKVPGHALIECISEFISRYNYENARQRETKNDAKAAPANVSDEEMKAFLGLIHQHGASVVGALLAAFGSCKEKWDGDEEASTPMREAGAHAKAV